MAKLACLKPRLSSLDTRKVKPITGAMVRLQGQARFTAKRAIFARDGGRCCICKRVVAYHDSQLDHRIALQFGGGNEFNNLWTLCLDCHDGKSKREAKSHAPDVVAMAYEIRSDDESNDDRYHII